MKVDKQEEKRARRSRKAGVPKEVVTRLARRKRKAHREKGSGWNGG